jgi:two-component system, chemotaxis family, sensor kinase CheA
MDKAHGKFLQEAAELMDDLEKAVLRLEQVPQDKEQVEEVFRVMHTFKGTAKMFGYDHVGEFTHHLESIFDDIRRNKLVLSDEILTIALRSVDHIRALLSHRDQMPAGHATMLEQIKKLTGTQHAPVEIPLVAKADTGKLYLIHFVPNADFLRDGSNPLYLLEDLAGLGDIHIRTYTDKLPDGALNIDETYLYWDILLYTSRDAEGIRSEFMFVEDQCELRINEASDRNLLTEDAFRELLFQYTERLSCELIQVFVEKDNVKTEAAGREQRPAQQQRHDSYQTIKVTYEKIDKLMNIVSELVTTQARLSLFTGGVRNQELEEITENVEKLVRQLRDEAFSISLLPISHLSVRFERLVRDTSRALSKQIRFETIGGDTELDKKIIENLADPMLHILRNSMDHGIELPDVRERKGKNPVGTIRLKAYYAGTNVLLEVQDDGAGIDKQRVWQKALQLGLAHVTDQLSDREIYDFIFHPGFSTARQITDVSGRGVGMDVVKRAIVNLRGEIEIESVPDRGTTIRLKLPLSLSIIDGLLVDIAKAKYVIPLNTIDKCYAVDRDAVRPDMNDLIVLDGEQVPYVDLRSIFRCQGEKPEHVNLIVAKQDERKVAFEVDRILDEYQAVIKPLGKIYKDQDFASGATILGNGAVALVLDTNRLMEL